MLGGAQPASGEAQSSPQPQSPSPPPVQPSKDPRVESIRQHLQRYKDLASQGKWAEAGRELEAIQSEVNK